MNFSSDRLRNSRASSSSTTTASQLSSQCNAAQRYGEGRISSSWPVHSSTGTALRTPALKQNLHASAGIEAGIKSLKIKIDKSSSGRKMPTSTSRSAAAAQESYETLPTARLTSAGGQEGHNTGGDSSSLPPSKRVRFCNTIAIRQYQTLLHQYKYFYDEEDLELFSRDIKKTIKKVRKGDGGELDPDQYTLRGLEHLVTRSIFMEMCEEKKHVFRLVLRAQSSGLTADEIADVYSRTSRGALTRALQRGLQYQADAF